MEQLPIGDIGVVPFELAHVADVLQLVRNEHSVRVTVAMNLNKDVVAVLPTILASKPSWTVKGVSPRILSICPRGRRSSLTFLEV